MPCVCVCVCFSLRCIWVLPLDPVGSSWNKQGRMLVTEIETCAASVLGGSAVWKEDRRNWTRSLTWGPSGRSWNGQEWTSFIPETPGGKREVQCCIQVLWRKCKDPCLLSSSGICVILLITAHSIMVRGERPSSTFHHPAAWLRLTGWCLSCRASSGPCWPSWWTRLPRPAKTFEAPHVRGEWRLSAVIHLFIQKFRKKKKENTRNSQIHISGWRKKTTPRPIYRWGKSLRPQIQSSKNKQKTIKWRISL